MATKTAPKQRGAKRKRKPKPRYFKGYGGKVAQFANDRIRQTKGRWAGKALILEPWQRDLLDELYLVDTSGRRVYAEALVGVPRKNGKSTLSAAIALHGLVATGEMGPEVYAAAASKDQARIVFQQAKEFVEASPKLRDHLTPLQNVIRCPANNGVFRVLSSDAPLQHGLNPSLVVIDELHAHGDPELYYALTTGTLARTDPLIVSITTAGYDRDSICWDVYSRGEALNAKGGLEAMRKAGFLHRWIAAPATAEAGDRKAWMAANPSSWITEEVVRREYNRLPEAVFRRLHLNQWTEAEDSWIRPDEWDALIGRVRFDWTKPVYAALDVGLKRDASALVYVQWHADRLHVKHEIRVPQPGRPIAAQDNRLAIQRLATKAEALKIVAFDPFAFTESAEMLADEGLPMVEFPQTNSKMCLASERLYELAIEGRLVVDGNTEFRRQVLAAVAQDTDRGWRLTKRKTRERTDAPTALAMAVDEAVTAKLNPEVPLNPDDYRIVQM